MVIFGVGLAGGIALALMGFVMPMLAKLSAMTTSSQAIASMPFLITINPENMPYIASQIMFGIATSAIICGLIAGKISSFKLGEGFRDAVICCLIVVLELFVGAAMGWV
jgi:asparagine N-glycosylation enzyme membrane subunit Stt3